MTTIAHNTHEEEREEEEEEDEEDEMQGEELINKRINACMTAHQLGYSVSVLSGYHDNTPMYIPLIQPHQQHTYTCTSSVSQSISYPNVHVQYMYMSYMYSTYRTRSRTAKK